MKRNKVKSLKNKISVFKNREELSNRDYKRLNAIMEVHNVLGAGFLEKVYENAVAIKLNKKDLKALQQAPFKVYFEGEVISEYFADVLVEDKIIVEIKCVQKISDVHRAQVINYLKATGLKLGIIANFAKPKLEYERIVL